MVADGILTVLYEAGDTGGDDGLDRNCRVHRPYVCEILMSQNILNCPFLDGYRKLLNDERDIVPTSYVARHQTQASLGMQSCEIMKRDAC